MSYRYSDFEFKAASRDGYGQDWPITYKELEPYYERVENYIGISGSYEGLPQLPDSRFLPPMRLSCGELVAKEIVEKKFGWKLIVDRSANLTVPVNGRPACHYCDQCQRGCFTASYFNSRSVTLPAAARTGRLHLVSDAVVSHVIMTAEGKAAARRVGLQILSVVKEELGSLDKVERLVKTLGMVNATADFKEHPPD